MLFLQYVIKDTHQNREYCDVLLEIFMTLKRAEIIGSISAVVGYSEVVVETVLQKIHIYNIIIYG